jgi:hypothetical protein
MRHLVKAAAIAALITMFGNQATASTATDALALTDISFETPESEKRVNTDNSLTNSAKIGIARLDGGRLIPTPFAEEFDWELLSRRTTANISVLSAGDYLKYIPEIPFNGVDTDNKIDEVRLTAVNEGYSHVLIYGMDTDAYLSSFGGKALSQTGLIVHEDCESWKGAKAKAILVNSHTGEVLGAATANDIEYNIGKLADDVERLLKELGAQSPKYDAS